MISFGLRDEVLEGRIREPDEVLAALDAVTVEDVQRVAQDIIRAGAAQPRGDRAVRRPGALRAAARPGGLAPRDRDLTPARTARSYG